MSSSSRMMLLSLLCLGLFAAACNKPPAPFEQENRKPRTDRDAPLNPAENHPDWAFSSPSYMRPVEELTPAPRAQESDPLHYFTKQRLVQIRQPADEAPDETPRVAVWWTDNNGFHWHRTGSFGRGQTFFPFEVEEDGDYGVRFVGPGQTPAVNTPAYPERVYHVDTHEPQMELTIDPEQSWYAAGQRVTISWRATDYHLIDDPVSVKLLKDFSAQGPQVVELQRGLAAEGTITYEIPAELVNQQVRFRVEAIDRAENLGLAYSHSLQIVEPKLIEATDSPGAEPDPAEEGAAEKPADERGEGEVAATPDESASADGLGNAVGEAGAPGTAAIAEDGNEAPEAAPSLDEGAITAVEMDLIGHARPAVPFGRTTTETPAAAKTADPASSKRDAKPRPSAGKADAAAPEAESMNDDQYQAYESEAADADANEAKPEALPAIENETSAETSPAIGAANGELTAVDITRGNGLLVPLPATVGPARPVGRLATLHPWRRLREAVNSQITTVWNLPRSRFSRELNKLFDGQYLADHPALRPVGEPGAVTRAVAGAPAAE